MCGIVGVISWSEQHRVTRADLKRMTDAIAHRGPDGEGFYFNIDPDDRSAVISPENPQVAFGFRRLAVLDPDPRSMQPFVSTDGRYVMVFNGEIYNFCELREELTALDPSYVWRTQGDTEVLLKGYAQWGEACLRHLNGMFALAIWDHEKKSLFLARDRMGQKPLYLAYQTGDGRFENHFQMPSDEPRAKPVKAWISSEASAFVELPSTNHHSDLWPLTDYLHHGYLSYAESFREGLHQLSPASYVEISATTNRCLSYWPKNLTPFGGRFPLIDDAIAVKLTRERLLNAVETQLISDVPLGCFLSGGVDSSVIALCARKHGPLKTFSITFEDSRYDESVFAREVAKHLSTDHHEFRVTPTVIEDLPKLARVFGDPFADSSAIPTHYLCRETRKHVTVALSGDGGDELFGGYDRYVAMGYIQKLQRLTTRFPWKLANALLRQTPDGHPKARWSRLKRFVRASGLGPASRYESIMNLFDGDTIVALEQRMLETATRSGMTHFSGTYYQWGEPHLSGTGYPQDRFQNAVLAAAAVDRVTYLPNDLLTKVDRCSMLHSLEVRSPFMDHELVELAAQLTEDQLLKGGKKRMLREAFASELPASVFNRPKRGFAVPIGEWFRGPLKSFLCDHLFAGDSFAKAHFRMPVVERLVNEHETEKRDHSQRLYALLMLEMWWKHVVRKDEG